MKIQLIMIDGGLDCENNRDDLQAAYAHCNKIYNLAGDCAAYADISS
jgi:hypothetical protein